LRGQKNSRPKIEDNRVDRWHTCQEAKSDSLTISGVRGLENRNLSIRIRGIAKSEIPKRWKVLLWGQHWKRVEIQHFNFRGFRTPACEALPGSLSLQLSVTETPKRA
jgi:hypothetical protein